MSYHQNQWEPYTGAGDAEDRRWRRWAERCVGHLDSHGWGPPLTIPVSSYAHTAQSIAWDLYCGGVAPAQAARQIRAKLRAGWTL